MKSPKIPKLYSILFIVICLNISLTSCYGPRINKKHEDSNTLTQSLAVAKDANLVVELNKLIVRNSYDSWAKDANWDEYLFDIENTSNQAITIQNITVIDGLSAEVVPANNRRDLNKLTRRMKNRFNKADIKIKLGQGSTNVAAGSVTGVVVGAGLGAGIASSGSVAVSAGTLTTAGGAVVVAVPALAIGGIVKIVNNSKVNNKIQERQSLLPLQLNTGMNSLDIFYPATPSPTLVNITYLINDQKHSLELILPDRLKVLHYKLPFSND